MGVDKNALAPIIQRFTGTNVTGYVNGKRMEYAVLLMKEHPEYTLSAISEACGIKSPATFIRNFRSTYDLTPSEYRKTLEELPPPNALIRTE
jgi:AraC-like DNA-binding protein